MPGFAAGGCAESDTRVLARGPVLRLAQEAGGVRALAAAGRSPEVQVFTHEWLVGDYGDPRSEQIVLPNAVPVQGRRDGGERTDGDGLLAVFLGRFSPEKGLSDLLAAWPDESAQRGWRLELYGDEELDVDLPPGVAVRGHAPDPFDVLARADLVVVPSRSETGPYVALEAASVSAPFVGTRVGDMTAMVEQARCGWLADPADPASLRSALAHAQTAGRSERLAAGSRGSGVAAGASSLRRVVPPVEELYRT